ncbi:nuclear pore complex protein DDB_G0274915 [Hyalella azteca]|uniref:Nuclear pore complex protein DDB_G0274915 n=1 Tax=Hyalella azteca TaxID=294128 RepID=A0A8B7PPD2_HYAAZ|nr:nuclear pore complex protein DDB_G0274915 [Hyalella azteca]
MRGIQKCALSAFALAALCCGVFSIPAKLHLSGGSTAHRQSRGDFHATFREANLQQLDQLKPPVLGRTGFELHQNGTQRKGRNFFLRGSTDFGAAAKFNGLQKPSSGFSPPKQNLLPNSASLKCTDIPPATPIRGYSYTTPKKPFLFYQTPPSGLYGTPDHPTTTPSYTITTPCSPPTPTTESTVTRSTPPTTKPTRSTVTPTTPPTTHTTPPTTKPPRSTVTSTTPPTTHHSTTKSNNTTFGMPYVFSYGVSDKDSGNHYNRHETHDGNMMEGQYKVLLPDGRTQVVAYFDKGHGYNAKVTYI